MPTFPIGHWTAKVAKRNHPLLNQPRTTSTDQRPINWTVTAGNEATLRGIPAIGRGVAGQIPGTRPDSRV